MDKSLLPPARFTILAAVVMLVAGCATTDVTGSTLRCEFELRQVNLADDVFTFRCEPAAAPGSHSDVEALLETPPDLRPLSPE